MKRDIDLARRILLTVESQEEAIGQSGIDLQFDEFTQNQISYHVMLLAEAGLLVATDLSDSDEFM